jgi:peptidoglycan/LPS O-acetylase OafA/YrhL
VLEALGVAVTVAAAVMAALPARLRWFGAATVLVIGILAERATAGRHDWVAVQLVGGKFPILTYVGFALVGMVAVQTGRHVDRRWVTSAALVAAVAMVALLADGITPDRYPGELPFVVPGLAGTVLVYAVGQYRWPRLLAPVDWLVRRAAAHTLGIFLFHYAVYAVLERGQVNGSVSPIVAVPVALAVTVGLCFAAPFVPQLPWSLRTGRGRPSPPRPAEPAASAPPVHKAVAAAARVPSPTPGDPRVACPADPPVETAGGEAHRVTGEAPLGSP